MARRFPLGNILDGAIRPVVEILGLSYASFSPGRGARAQSGTEMFEGHALSTNEKEGMMRVSGPPS